MIRAILCGCNNIRPTPVQDLGPESEKYWWQITRITSAHDENLALHMKETLDILIVYQPEIMQQCLMVSRQKR